MLGLVVLLTVIFVVFPAIAFFALLRLSQRVADLERAVRSLGTPAVEHPVAPTLSPSHGPAAGTTPLPPPPAPAPAPPPVTLSGPVRNTPARRDWTSEQVVGGTWLQNIGSVLVLLGVFFLFLWGYTTGRFGPGVLVAAGVAFGALLVWRGDRTIPTLPAFGHAVIGIGLGIAYLALYSGHFVVRVFGIAPAIAFLAVAAVTSIAVGMRYRVQLISVLGVIGAFVPWIAGFFTGAVPATGSAGALLAYLLAVDAISFVLAARAGWSGLALTATALTTITWVVTQWSSEWSLPVQAGLCALYLGLGLALVPRIVSGRSSSRPVDLAAVGIAPWAFAIASAPFLSDAPHATTATILAVMAAVYGLSAILVDARRPQRDLWSQFVVAASAFVAAAIERALGDTLTPLAWCVQGLTLVALGLVPRGGALRVSGYVLLGLGATTGIAALRVVEGTSHLPVVTPDTIRTALSIGTLLVAARLLERHRDHMLEGERAVLPRLALAVAHASLAYWTALHMSRVAHATLPGGLSWERHLLVTAALTALAWATHGAVLALQGFAGGAWRRVVGYALVLGAGGAFFTGTTLLGVAAGNPYGGHVATHVSAVLLFVALAPVLALIDRGARDRARLRPGEFEFLRLITAAALVAGLVWSVCEANVLARHVLPAEDRVTLGAALASAAWTAGAIVVFTIGWFRGSPFLRWLGIGTLGLTILKFLFVDLARVNPFWRFLTAIAVGCVLLALSYVYQRARRAAAADGAVEVAPAAGNAYPSASQGKDDA